jgi:hypothetical protein
MRLSEIAIQRIGEKNLKPARAIRLDLALELNFTELWVEKCIAANKSNGPLTTSKALSVIERGTGLSQSEILEEDDPVTAQVESRA